jgi:hypothetical protein
MKSIDILSFFLFFQIVISLKTQTHTHTNTKSKTNMNSHFTFKNKDAIKNYEITQNEITKEALKMQNNSLMVNLPMELDIGEGPIFWNGWIKFVKYEVDNLKTQSSLNHFHRNDQFTKQMQSYPNINTEERVDNTYKYIRDNNSFYALLLDDYFNILSAREKDFEKTVEILQINNIKNMTDPKTYKGGIEDFGNFKEGFCFKIKTVELKKNFEYILCVDSFDEKRVLMSFLRIIKLRHQKILYPSLPTNLIKQNSLSDVYKKSKKNELDELPRWGIKDEEKNCSYIILQDWSPCSVKCGGGISTLHRVQICHLKNGTESLCNKSLNKTCNEQPCPQIIRTTTTANNKILPPIYHVLPFLNRPQKYTKCKIKEADLLYTKNLSKEQIRDDVEKVQIPVRVVMNNRTISIFGNEKYDSLIVSFDLKKSIFYFSKWNTQCFIIKEVNKKAELCPFGHTENDSVRKQWEYDFKLFQQKCYQELPLSHLQMEQLQNKLKDKIKSIQREVSLEKENILSRKLRNNEDIEYEKNLKKTNELAFSAIKKELTMQELIKREEEEKELEEENEIKSEIDKEERKGEIFLQAIKQKEIEDQFNIKAETKQKELNAIKDEVTKEVIKKREGFTNLLKIMKKRADRKKMVLRSKLIGVRMDIASKMKDAYKNGDMNKCENGITNASDRNAYCSASFQDDFQLHQECLNSEFCVICCEHEYGSANLDSRQKCLDQVCNKERKAIDAELSNHLE